jgi:predicted nucleotide-binding protein (sugar kinase/HSP70/actin superfamily)
VRVVAINAQDDGGAVPLKIPAKVMWRAALAMLYGDLMMRLSLRTRPYELSRGDTDSLYEQWKERVKADVRDGGWHLFKSEVKAMVRGFAAVPISSQQKPRVGVVGEILVKYHAGANEHIVDTIEREGGEAYVPDLSNFLLYCMHDPIYKNRSLGGAFMPALLGEAGIRALEFLRAPVKKAIAGTRFGEIHSIESMAEKSKGIVSQSNQGGEGWLLTAEMAAMIESGVKNILCIQPFSCLPDHITGKGVIKELKRRYENVNILALDFDASVSAVNQLNRIKLLMATSRV